MFDRVLNNRVFDLSYLTHFRPMFLLRINQVVGFTSKILEKHLWKSGILSKDAGHRPPFLLKQALFHRCFSNILLVKINYLIST